MAADKEKLYHATIYLKSGGHVVLNHLKSIEVGVKTDRATLQSMKWRCSDRTAVNLMHIDLEEVVAVTTEVASS